MSKSPIGYGKPPVHSRFKKGKSGNAKGRPKKSQNFSTVLNNALNETVTIRKDGRSCRVSKLETLVLALFQKAVTSDVKAISELLKLKARLPADDIETELAVPMEADIALLERYGADAASFARKKKKGQ